MSLGKENVVSLMFGFFSPNLQCFFIETGRAKRSLKTNRNITAPSGRGSIENKAVNIPCDASNFLNHIQLKLRSKAGTAASGIYPFIPLPSPSIAFAVMHKCLQLRANTARLHQLQKESFQPLFFKTNKNSLLPGNFCCLSCHSYLPRIMLYRTQSLIMFLSRTHKHHPGSKQVDLS